MADNVIELPLRPPAVSCNARLSRGVGYCANGAGLGTEHVGFGRCKLHGGLSPRDAGVDGPADLFRAIGLGAIIDLAETMTRDDQEYLMEVGTNALTVIRAKIVAKLNATDAHPKDLNDLSMALTRVEKVLAQNLNEVKGEAEGSKGEDGEAELARVLNIGEALEA
jgi:hypothetical protein